MTSEERRRAREALGALLRELRVAAGLTQPEVATRLRRPQSFVSKYERAERKLDLIEMGEVCEALRVKPAELMRRFEGSILPP
jgi:transcriptional regulator with XRE-family HTH domain